MIKTEYQEIRNRRLVHEYIEFDREKAVSSGENEAVKRYDFCLKDFMKQSEALRKEGIVYCGETYDFFFKEKEDE